MPADDPNPKHAPSIPDITTPEDPTIRARRTARRRSDDGEAFLPDPSRPGAPVDTTDAEFFGEEFVASATSGEPVHMDALDQLASDEDGGPFLELDTLEGSAATEADADAGEEVPEATDDDLATPAPRSSRGPRPARRSPAG